MRPGCDRDAVARLTYDTITCQVWLDGVVERQSRNQEICILHAERLTVPRGWMLCDRRRSEPALYVAASSGSPATTVDQAVNGVPAGRPGRRRSPSRPTRTATRTMELFHDALDELPELAVMDPTADGALAPVTDPPPAEPAVVDPLLSEPPLAESTIPAPATTDPVPTDPADDDAVDVDDLPESLRATSPLLARAFAASGPQRSVLTQARTDTDVESSER